MYIIGTAQSTIIRIAFLNVKPSKSSSIEMDSVRGDSYAKGIME